MQAIKLEAIIDKDYELHLKLPDNVKLGRAEVIVMFEDDNDSSQPSADAGIATRPLRQFGQFRGQVHMADDFDMPLSDEFWLGER